MRKIVICDDEQVVRQQLLLFCRHLEAEIGETFEITCYSNGEAVLEGALSDSHVLLLDIRMGSLSGLDVARRLRSAGSRACIIFITSLTHCALEGYSVHAFGFIAKPFDYMQFKRQLSDAFEAMDHRGGTSIALKGRNGTTIYRTDDVLYFEILGRTLSVVAKRERSDFAIPLKQIEDEVTRYGFFKTHKSYLVNLDYVQSISGGMLTMANGDEIPLSKHRKAAFMKELGRFARKIG